ncbi:MAG: radical SAM protein [Deltaproteobacteria bacterium]|nr:radical SAM protein [Deltaproteobacteria bacterium]
MPAQTVRVTLRCNHGCVFCFAEWCLPQRRRDVHDYTNVIGDDWRSELDEVRAAGYDELSISGGEPLLHPELVPMVRHAKALGFSRIEVQTNASLMTTRNVARLRAAGMTASMASLPSHVPRAFDAITRTKGHFQASVDGIRNLLRARVEVILCHVICAGNYRLLPDYVRFADETLHGINEILFFYVQPEGRAARNPRLFPRLTSLRPRWLSAMSEADRLGLYFRTDTQTGLPLCYMTGHEDRLKLIDLLDPRAVFGTDVSSFEYMQGNKRKAPACGTCFFDPVCFGFWKTYLEAHGDGELRPVPEDARLRALFPAVVERHARRGTGHGEGA